MISATLLLIAISSAWSVYMEGHVANRNAQEANVRFDLIVLKNETTERSSEVVPVMETVETESPVVVLPVTLYSPIAKISAERIGLNVSVLSEWSYELLDISVNKFSGPEPNEVGNFIVIGHSYLSDAHFGSLHLLKIGDLMELTDLSGRKLTYEVYEIQVIKPEELEKLLTDQVKTLTLVTCDTDNQFRLVVKSKAIRLN